MRTLSQIMRRASALAAIYCATLAPAWAQFEVGKPLDPAIRATFVHPAVTV